MDLQFGSFDLELEEFEFRKTKTFVRGWNATFGGSVASSPKIADGILYFGSMDQNVYAVNPKTGKEMWRTKLGGIIIFCNPVFWKGLLMIGTLDQKFYAMNKRTGKIA
ncbi:MAG: PQQ-binding-like beta-propeller repeat protein, partial [Candidatus Aenigmarchaeota archaeon]|nr:PQQ-binding-like beta-propeller repeat protein [Candidatus Aenigmarchaeota archaeon]NIQ17304.1 PQQ-binding-like beta-propeller repeat protein [Candidatus Aenigmarchaeota archaeon]NIS73165.1 PQQ-binding-like beta-propeller repeat protein [Candidatus Aenigmarchaeota archaeon]